LTPCLSGRGGGVCGVCQAGPGVAPVVKLPASEQGPPFRVFSGRGSEEVASVALSLPSEPFLYLSPDSFPQGGETPFLT
jgi:hypothetical protein